MKIKTIITGATGMVGKGVLLECLDHPQVESVLVINRRSIGFEHPKMKEIIHKDFYDLSSIADQLEGYNACYFCLGVSSMGISKEDYYKMTYTLTIHMAEILAERNPDMTFCYVSGDGTSTEENSRMDWANVKGKTENKILSMPFRSAYAFRPGAIQPMRGIKSSTAWYNVIYTITNPIMPFLRKNFPNSITDTTSLGKAMINVTLYGYEEDRLYNKDMNVLAIKY